LSFAFPAEEFSQNTILSLR